MQKLDLGRFELWAVRLHSLAFLTVCSSGLGLGKQQQAQADFPISQIETVRPPEKGLIQGH